MTNLLIRRGIYVARGLPFPISQALIDVLFRKYHVASKLNPTDAVANRINQLYAATSTALTVRPARDQQENEEEEVHFAIDTTARTETQEAGSGPPSGDADKDDSVKRVGRPRIFQGAGGKPKPRCSWLDEGI